MGFIVLCMATMTSAAPAVTGGAIDGSALFDRLKKLEGNWKSESKTTASSANTATWRQVANGTALLHTTSSGDRASISTVTVFALEGKDLVASHFSAGGATRLKVVASTGDMVKLEASGKDAPVWALVLTLKEGKLAEEWVTRFEKRNTEYTREYVDTLK